MYDIKKYLIAMEMSKASEAHIKKQLEATISEGMEQGITLDRSGKAKYKASIEDLFNITKQQADIVRQAVQEIGDMNPKGIQQLKNQLKETMDFVSGILEKTKDIVDVDDLMSQGKGIGQVYGDMYQKLENVDKVTRGLKTSMKGLEKSFKPFMAALGSMDGAFNQDAINAVAKAEKKLKSLKQPELLEYAPGDFFSEKSTDELIKKQKELTAAILESERALSGMKKTDNGYDEAANDLAEMLADLKAVNNVLAHDQFGTKDITTKIVATLTEAGDALENKIKNLKIDDIKLTVTLPDANAENFNAQIDDFVKQATEKFKGKPIEVSVDLISPFKDAKADVLPPEHEKKARELAEKFINAYNESISQKEGADKKAKEAIDISGQLSALYDPSVSSVIMKFWDSWNKIYDSVKAGQTTLLEATKTWKQKMAEELRLKFVWVNEDAVEGISDLFERINLDAEKNPIYLVPAKDYLIKEIEKVLSEHRFSLNVDLGDTKIPINFTGGSGGSGGSGSGGTPTTPPASQPPSQTPPTPNSVPNASRELAETVEEMQEFAYTAESIGDVVERLSNNVNNISARITTLTNEINDLDLDKTSTDKDVQKRKDETKEEVKRKNAILESYKTQKKEQEAAKEIAKKEEEAAQARLDAEKARRDKASQDLRAERDTLFADNRTGQHTDRILELNAQIKELEAPFEDGIEALENAFNEAHKKLLGIERKIRETEDNIARTNIIISELTNAEKIEDINKDLAKQNKELTAEKSKQTAFKSILDKNGNPVSLITDRLTTFWESTDETIEKSRDKMQKLAPKLFSMENELKELQYELDSTDEEHDKDNYSALQERINALQDKISEAEKAMDQKALVKYRNYAKDAGRASTRQNWMRAFGLSDIRDLGADEALEVITSVLQHYPALAASLSSAANGKVNLKGLDIVKQLISFIPDVQSTLGVVATTNSESNEDLLLKETFVNLFRIADQLNALDGLVDKKTGEVTVDALSGFITAFEKMPQMAMVVQKAKALQKSTEELSEVLGDNDQLKEAFDIGEAKKYLTESFYDLWKAMPETVRSKLHHNTLDLNKLNSVDKSDGFVKVVYDEFVRAFSAGNLDILKTDSPEWQSLISLLKQGAIYANHEKATKGLKDSVMGSDGIKRGLYELLHSADPIHVRVVGRDGLEHDYGVQDTKMAKMDVERTYNQTPRSLRRAANKFGITDLLNEKLTIEKGIDAEILQVESELVVLDERISKLDKEADKRQIEQLSALRETKQRKLGYLRELSKTDDGRRQYEKESARRLREIDEEVFGKVSLSTKKNAPQRKARRNYAYGNDPTVNKVKDEIDRLEDEKKRLKAEIDELDKKETPTEEENVLRKNKAARLEVVESLLAEDNAQKMAIESVRELDKDIETNTERYKEAENNVTKYTQSLEALADAERKKNVLKDTRDNTFNTISRGLGKDNSTLYKLGVAKQYGTMDQQLVENLEARIAGRSKLMERLDAIPMSEKYDAQGNYKGKAAKLAKKIKELRIKIAQKYSEAEGSYLTNLLAEQLEQIDAEYDRQESDAKAQAEVKSSDYQTQADAANEQHRQNVAKINSTIDTQKAYYENLIGNAQREANRITEEWQEKVSKLNEDVDTRVGREVRSKDAELKDYYGKQIDEDDRVIALRQERITATDARKIEISKEINKIALEYTEKYREEVAKFKENLVRDLRQQMEEEARKVEEEGRRNAAQVLENAKKEAVATYNNSESRTGKKVRVYTSIERELEERRKAAIEAEVEAHKSALAQITQVDPKQIEQETKDELARIKAEREAKKKEAIDEFKENGVYKDDETLVTEHITAAKEGAEKKADALNQELEQRRNMRKTLMEEYQLTEEMVGTQKKVANADAKRVKVKVKSAQSSATESNTPPKQEPPTPSGGGSSGSGGGSYGGFINTNGLAQESTLRGIWELLNGGAPAGGWGDEDDGKSGDRLSHGMEDDNRLIKNIRSIFTKANIDKREHAFLLNEYGQVGNVVVGDESGVKGSDIRAEIAKQVGTSIRAVLHTHPFNYAAGKHLSHPDVNLGYDFMYGAPDGQGIPLTGSVFGDTATLLDWTGIDETDAKKIRDTFVGLMREFSKTIPESETFDNNPELQRKYSEAYNKYLRQALNENGHLDALKQVGVSGVQDAINKIVSATVEQHMFKIFDSSTSTGSDSNLKSTISQEEIDRYYTDHVSKFRTVKGENGNLKYADDKFSSRVGQALLNSKVLNKDGSTFVQADAKKLQTAYDQIQQALAQEASKALGEDVIAFLQKLQGEIAQKLQANGYGLEKLDTSPSALIKDTVVSKKNINRAKTYLGRLSGDEYNGSDSVSDGLELVKGVLSNKKQKLNYDDIKDLGNGYERLMRAVQSGLASKFDEDTQTLINEAIRISKQVLDQYNAEVIGSGSLLGKEITEETKELITRGVVGKVVTDMTDPAIKINGKIQQKASVTMPKKKKKESAAPQPVEEGNVTESQKEQEKLTRKTAENKERQAKATQEVAEADKEALNAEKEAFKQQKDAIASLFYTTGENGNKVWSKDKNAQDLTFGLTNASKIFKDDLSESDVANLHKTGLNLSKVLNLDQIDGKVLTDEMKAFIRDLIEKIKAKLNVDSFVEQESKPKASQPKSPPAPKPAPTTTPTYSAGVPQPTGGGIGGGGLPLLNNVWGQILNVVAKDITSQQILEAITNGIKTTGSGGQQSGDSGQKHEVKGYDDALKAMTEYVHKNYPGADHSSKIVRENANSYSADFWRKSAADAEELEKINARINQMNADGIEDEQEYINLLQQKEALLQRQEKITVKINKENGNIEAKVGIQDYAVGANAAEKELSKFQGILSKLHDAGAIGFKEDGTLTSQNQTIDSWLEKIRELQKLQDDLSGEGTLFAAKNQPGLSNMTAQVSQLTKEVLDLLGAESKFSGNVVGTFDNPQTLAGTGELYNQLLKIATASGKVDMATVKLSADGTTLTYTIEKGKNQVQDMTLHMNSLSGVVTQQAGEIRHVDTAWEKFGKSLKGKWQEVARYLATFGSIYRVWGMLKQGVGYIKEIDDALTELKKVTDQTNTEYKQFLQTMSKTAGAVGSTVKDLTSSAADWARLNI